MLVENNIGYSGYMIKILIALGWYKNHSMI